jgi:hypothetical protein
VCPAGVPGRRSPRLFEKARRWSYKDRPPMGWVVRSCTLMQPAYLSIVQSWRPMPLQVDHKKASQHMPLCSAPLLLASPFVISPL